MKYHIQTAPIWDAFREYDGCPLCFLYARIENRLIKQYSGEAVMQPEYRIKVNERGFCHNHLHKLFFGDNKLGVALQLNTHIDNLLENIANVDNPKKAQKLADNLYEKISSCVICDELSKTMERYYYTIAQMFDNEVEFPILLTKSNGFCMPHFTMLLRYSAYAGKSASTYLSTLTKLQKDSLKKDNSSLEQFTRLFDYKNSSNQNSNHKNALARNINRLNGDFLDE